MGKFIKKLKSSELGMRVLEKFYPNYYSDPNSPRLLITEAIKRFKDCKEKKNTPQINAEIAAYKKFWKCYPYDYFLCDLYRKDKSLTRDELINYIPGFFWYYLYLPHHTSYKLSMIIDNKIITEHFFKSLNIHQPKTLFRVMNRRVYSPEMELYSFEQVQTILNKESCEKIFVKPAEGGGSKGIFIFHKKGPRLYRMPENIPFNENFLSNIGIINDYIIQSGIDQDQKISDIYPNSINTCRIITENFDGSARIVCAMLRMGCGQSDVDNISAGGLCTKIDLNTGKIGDVAKSYKNEEFLMHPDTHFIFRNFIIPRWDEIRNFTINSAGKLPFFTHLGWDIALTGNGPVAIETNLGIGIEANQIANGGLREAFGIDDPDYYWKNPGKRAENMG